MRVLVTGAAGYIGSHFVKAMAERGHEVIGTDWRTDQNDVSKYCEMFNWDITQRDPCKVPYFMYDKVVHIAAQTKVNVSMHYPWRYYNTNINGTRNVIDNFIPDHFVYCSTGSAFNPNNPYSASKLAAEQIVRESFPKRHTIVRFYNVSGNDGFKKYDDEHFHLIRKAAATANGVYDSMAINGTDYDTRDGTVIRNYTHVTDIVNGLVNATEHDPMNTEWECLGTTEGVTVREVIDTMKRVSGVDFDVTEGPRREGDYPVSTIPYPSQFFHLSKTLEDQCRDALAVENEEPHYSNLHQG